MTLLMLLMLARDPVLGDEMPAGPAGELEMRLGRLPPWPLVAERPLPMLPVLSRCMAVEPFIGIKEDMLCRTFFTMGVLNERGESDREIEDKG